MQTPAKDKSRFFGTASESGPENETYEVSRFLILRMLGLIYLAAFVGLARQGPALLGHFGLQPVDLWLEARERSLGGFFSYFASPTVFWFCSEDWFLNACAWFGAALAAAAALGVTNALVQLALWALYLSFVEVGQIFYGYGWEIQLLETGFLAVFLCPLCGWRPFPRRHRAPPAVIWLFRWLVFRVMFGAGLIKLRADSCWRNLSCLFFHFETQPLPNPLSPFFHRLPHWVLQAGVVVNHFVELIAPWMMLGPRTLRIIGAAATIGFQLTLILSGNLSWLNWLTIVPALASFDDRWWKSLLGRVPSAPPAGGSPTQRVVLSVLVLLIGVLSIFPIVNMLSSRQAMNASFEPFRLVNTYGAFGSVGSERYEIVLEATEDSVISTSTEWREIELPCKPGDVNRRPCFIAPYQPRLDWQIWFAAMSRFEQNPWLIHLIAKLLAGDAGMEALLADGALHGEPPRYIRGLLYRYRFAESGAHWWDRELVGVYFPPLSLESAGLQSYLRSRGWWERLRPEHRSGGQ